MSNDKLTTREEIRAIVSELDRLDDQLAKLAESLPLPSDVAEMWEGTIPSSFTANFYSALDAVRCDCVQDTVTILLCAVRQSEVSLRYEWCAQQEEKRSILLDHHTPRRLGRNEGDTAMLRLLKSLPVLLDGVDLGSHRLAVVPDGALHFVPFGVLPAPRDRRRLLETHEIVSFPSASTLVHLWRDLAERPLPPDLLAVVADPIFSLTDPRLTTPAARSASPAWRFRCLPASAEEARRLVVLTKGHETLLRLGFDADRELVLGGRLARFR